MTTLLRVAMAIAITGLTITCSAASSYTITDLGTLGGNSSRPMGISADGQIAGYSRTSTGETHAFLFANGNMTDLGTFGGTASRANDISPDGVITGFATLPNGEGHAFLYSQGTMTDLGRFGSSATNGMGINPSGTIVGSWSSAGGTQPFIYSDGSYSAIPGFSKNTLAIAVNNQMQVALNFQFANRQEAFIYEGGAATNLGSLGGLLTAAADINDAGTIVGWSTRSDSPRTIAFSYRNGQMHDLGTLGSGDMSFAEGINSLGEIVGASNAQPASSLTRAFLYRDGQMIDLNSEISSDRIWTLTSAIAINDRGQITGYGKTLTDHGFEEHAFLLTPVPEPSAYILVAIGVIALLTVKRRTR